MSDLTVRPWHRYGQHRLYVDDATGTRIGWYDLTTGRTTIEEPAQQTAFEAALQRRLAAEPELATSYLAGAVPPQRPTIVRAERPWTDLATNRPGEGIATLAAAERQAAPVRTLLARVAGVHTSERAWRVGSKGESLVGAQLAKLPASWRVLHSVPVGTRGCDIDHVVIGPGGVYTVNTKHHPDKAIWVGGSTVLVDGQRQPYVRSSEHEAERAARLLGVVCDRPVPVCGVVAIVGAKTFQVKTQPSSGVVFVLGRREICSWLLRRGTVLEPDEVDAIYDRARRSTTWTG